MENNRPEVGDTITCSKYYKGEFKKVLSALVDDGWFVTAGKNVDGDYVIRLEGRPGEER